MVLESCMILLDNSEFMRNGDYIPSRLEAQHDAANLLVSHKTQSNPESTVGVIALCGSDGSGSAELLVSPTDDMGKILGALHGIPIRGGAYDVCASVQVASLALKHRRNKNGAQRVVLFVGSPLDGAVDKRALVKAGKLLKKNNVSIDVISMGEDNEEKLKDLVDAANGTTSEGEERTCHLVTIPPGVLPSDVLITSPIVRGAGAGGASGAGPMDLSGGGGGDAFAEYGGVDPNMDPELAMALRVSMEEERARQERLAREAAEQQRGEEETKTDTATAMDVEETKEEAAAISAAVADGDEMGDEDALLQQALAMSMAEQHGASSATEEAEMEGNQKAAATAEPEIDEEEDEDAAMQMALQMSMATDNESSQQQDQFQDPQFVNQLLGSLPGVNPNDPAIQNALSNLQRKEKDEEKENKDDEKK